MDRREGGRLPRTPVAVRDQTSIRGNSQRIDTAQKNAHSDNRYAARCGVIRAKVLGISRVEAIPVRGLLRATENKDGESPIAKSDIAPQATG